MPVLATCKGVVSFYPEESNIGVIYSDKDRCGKSLAMGLLGDLQGHLVKPYPTYCDAEGEKSARSA